MADVALENALARRRAIRDRVTAMAHEINALATKLRDSAEEMKVINDFITQWYEMAGIDPPADDHEEEHIEPVSLPMPKVQRPINPDRTFVAMKCVEYIRKAERPMSRRQLFEALAADTIRIHGKDPEMVLSTMLWRSQHIIKRLPGGGYWPADLPPPMFDHSD